MKYRVKFPNPSLEAKFAKALSKIPQANMREKIMQEVERLAYDPRPPGKKIKILTVPVSFQEFAARYRIRIGDYRVLYDVDDDKKTVWVLFLARRSEHTYI